MDTFNDILINDILIVRSENIEIPDIYIDEINSTKNITRARRWLIRRSDNPVYPL